MIRARAWVAKHRKLVVFAAGAVLTVAIQIWGTSNPYVSLGILIATGAGVYQAPNVMTVAGHARLVRPASPGTARPANVTVIPQPARTPVAITDEPPPPPPGPDPV